MIDRPSFHPTRCPPLPSGTKRTAAGGFSLIELLITVAILGILAAVAYPSYGQYVRETRRSDGHLALLAAVQTIERCRATRYSYAGCALTATESPEGYYKMTLAATASTYTLTATAQNLQTTDTDCSTITLDHVGTRGPLASGGGASECWN